MKILIEVADAADVVDLMALINGSAAATGKKRPQMVVIEDTNLAGAVRRGRDKPGVGYAFETLLIPLAKIDHLTLDRNANTSNLALLLDPPEYAILDTLHRKDLANRPKAPF